MREHQPSKWLDENIVKWKDYPFAGLKWEVAPCLPQEPHCFSGGSSQNKDKEESKTT